MCDDESLNKLCPIMQAQNARIRGNSECFDVDNDVCTALSMLYNSKINFTFIIQEQLKKQIMPNNNVKVVLPPIIAPLGQPLIPVIIMPSPTSTTTTTTTTTTSSTTTTTPAPTTSTTTPITIITTTMKNLTLEQATQTEDQIMPNDLNILENLVNSTTPHTHIVEKHAANITALPPLLDGIAKVTETIEKLQESNKNMEEIHESLDIIENPTILEQTEYATVKYLEEINELQSEPDKILPNVLDDDSKSNSVHEEFPSVALADLDNAPQSLLIPEEPPENP